MPGVCVLRDSRLDIEGGDCIAVMRVASTARDSGVIAAVGIMPGMAGKGAARPAGSGVIEGSAVRMSLDGGFRGTRSDAANGPGRTE